MNAGRLYRTLSALKPIQVAARVPQMIAHRSIPHVLPLIGGFAPPRITQLNVSELARAALTTFARSESDRAIARIPRLKGRLQEYERAYGFELGGVSVGEDVIARWSLPAASEPYAASVRARRLATAVALDHSMVHRGSLAEELARAARAILLQPEFHLLGNHILENA